MSIVAAWLGGVVLWTWLEYVLHRFAFHRRIFGAKAAWEHLEHHAKVDYFTSPATKLAAAVPVTGGLAIVGMLVAPVEVAVPFALGLLSGWMLYEWIHRRIHVAAPRGAYERWSRKHHLAHHFVDANQNHGVTSPVWDVAFGTLRPVPVVGIPRRHATKFPWLLLDAGAPREGLAVRPEYASEYKLVG